MKKICTKIEDFKKLNEEASSVHDLRSDLMVVLKNASDHICGTDGKKGCTIVKDGKKSKLTSSVIDGSAKNPRYMPNTPAPKTTPVVQSGTNSKAATSSAPINFVFNKEGESTPIADFKFSVNGKNISMVETKTNQTYSFNKMNMKYIPDQMQDFIEKNFGKVETA